MGISRRVKVGVGACAASSVALVVLSACSQQQLRDVEDVPVHDPDKVELIGNVDDYPNIVRLCIDGVAFGTTTRNYDPVFRVPEWDDTFCAD